MTRTASDGERDIAPPALVYGFAGAAITGMTAWTLLALVIF